MAVMVLHILNFYSNLFSRHATIKELSQLKEFRLSKYQSQAKMSEKTCYVSCFILSFLIAMSFLIFHPILGRTQDTPIIYVFSVIEQYYLFLYPLCFFFMLLTAYAQIFSILHVLYRSWGMQILFYHLKEYIERNLSGKYDSFDVIDSKSEQEKFYCHLKRCAKFHQKLKW